MSISITFNGETPEDIQREIADWHNLLIAGACAISNDRAANAHAATARAAEVRVAQEKAQRAETYAANVADLKEIAAAMPVVDVSFEEMADVAPEPVADVAPEPVAADVPDYAVVREAVLRLAVTKSSDITRALLSTYGVRIASDLDPSRWNELLADVNATLKE
jgi:hypothetical protein